MVSTKHKPAEPATGLGPLVDRIMDDRPGTFKVSILVKGKWICDRWTAASPVKMRAELARALTAGMFKVERVN